MKKSLKNSAMSEKMEKSKKIQIITQKNVNKSKNARK